mmetsp:Transcript_14023/g.20199  ORF Transcript_14023/g.20199 Transcript_14023/m.20199 type:complete len:84 (+) Transcript_14023:404-655(+)
MLTSSLLHPYHHHVVGLMVPVLHVAADEVDAVSLVLYVLALHVDVSFDVLVQNHAAARNQRYGGFYEAGTARGQSLGQISLLQ